MTERQIAGLGILANLMFWPLMFYLAALRPDYSHLHQAVSELGALGAPHGLVWNLFGFIAPGLLLAVFGWNLVRRLRPKSRVAASLLALAGVSIAFAGVFSADMDDRQGLTTTLHLIGASGSLLAWVPGVLVVALLSRKVRPDIAITSVLALAAMIGSFWLYGPLSETPALVQRVTFGVFFGWYLCVALLLLGVRRPLPA
ncbi:MAG: DUF998 domain-containing protein [Brevundimonas sp.]